MNADTDHLDALTEAIRLEGEGHRLLLSGDGDAAAARMRAAAAHYRDSWEAAPPRSFGRLLGMLKAAVIAGDATEEARYARAALGVEGDSPSSWYALAIAALIEGDDPAAARAAAGMRPGSPAFARTADAIEALALREADRYAAALRAIVADFETRNEHLTGVPIADTALMLERLAEPRGLAARPPSALLPN
jgi:hypothetical protein